MKSLHLLLEEAERAWRENVRRDFPLRSDTPVIKKTLSDGRDWTFSTDLTKIFASITRDKKLQQKFKGVVQKYWSGDSEALARETLHYLLFHELYHPLEAPFSVVGENNDNKRIHQAIRRGLVQAEPDLTPLEQVVKVHASQNGVKDFILDNRFYLDNQAAHYVQKDVIPIWDLLEVDNTPATTNFYTITRFLYGVLYGPQSTHDLFATKAGKDGAGLAEKALHDLIARRVTLPRKKNLVGKLMSKVSARKKPASAKQGQLSEYVRAIRDVFSGTDRYEGITRFMTVLGPYVEVGMPQRIPDMGSEELGSSPQNILQDLLDGMPPEEQATFLQGVYQESTAKQEPLNMDVFALHEFYKRNHPQVKIIGGKKVGETLVVGKQEYWHLKSRTILTDDKLQKVNLPRLEALQRKTRLPWLIHLGNGTYRLDEYELKQRDLKTIVYRDDQLDVPDVIDFYLDHSGSMFHGTNLANFLPNDGSRWDMLNHVLYGLVDAVRQAGQKLGKQSKIRLHTFANTTLKSNLITVEDFWKGDVAALNGLFKPDLDFTNTDLNLNTYNPTSKTATVICTDGQVRDPQREAEKIKVMARQPHHNVVLFEIGATYDLGNAVKNDPHIVYHQVHNPAVMFQAGLEVLLAKREGISGIGSLLQVTRGADVQ